MTAAEQADLFTRRAHRNRAGCIEPCDLFLRESHIDSVELHARAPVIVVESDVTGVFFSATNVPKQIISVILANVSYRTVVQEIGRPTIGA